MDLSSKAIVFSGGTSGGTTPTSLAGVIATVLAVRGYTSLSAMVAVGRSSLSLLGNASDSATKLGTSRRVSVGGLLCYVLMGDTGRTTIILTSCVNNKSIGTFMNVVGSLTSGLKYRGARFVGPRNLSVSKRCAATESLTGVARRTLALPMFARVMGAMACALPTSGGDNREGLLSAG